MNELLVVALKFNDIYYAVSTEEFKNAAKKKLLILYTSSSNPKQFPCLNLFDEIITFKYKIGTLGLLNNLFRLVFFTNQLKADICFISNPVLLAVQLIIIKTGCSTLILLEDGLMNYYNFVPLESSMKRIIQMFMGVSTEKICNRIQKTYLLKPKLSIFAFGDRVQLKLHSFNNPQFTIDLSNKSILVGQDFYTYGLISIEEYNKLMNSLIKKNKIDFYLPHPYASELEDIMCSILDLKSFGLTLEVLASKSNFRIFSLGSSVLYTAKCINPDISCYLIRSYLYRNVNNLSIITKFCDDIIEM